MAGFADLSQEIIDYIIDLAFGEKLCDFSDDGWRKLSSSQQQRDMAACTLVSSSFHTRSSRYLLQRVSHRSQSTLQLASTLENLPRISSNVQTIVMTCKNLELPEISRVLRLLPRLHSISITLTDTSRSSENASNLRPLNLDVKNVYLSGVHSACFLYAFLSLFTDIGFLDIDRCDDIVGALDLPESCAPKNSLRVNKLAIDNSDLGALPVLQDVLAPGCPTTLYFKTSELYLVSSDVEQSIRDLCRTTRHLIIWPSLLGLLFARHAAMGALQLPNLTALHMVHGNDNLFYGIYSFLDRRSPMEQWADGATRFRLGFLCTEVPEKPVGVGLYSLQSFLGLLPAVTTLQFAVVCEGGHYVSAASEQRVRQITDAFVSSLKPGSELHSRLTVQYVGIIPPPEEL